MNKKKNNKSDKSTGSIFDLNHDGEIDIIEWRTAHGIRNANAEDDKKQSSRLEFKDPLKEKEKRLSYHDWRDGHFEGDEYGIDPDDYETEEDYLESVGEAIDEDVIEDDFDADDDFDTDSDGDWDDGDSSDSFDGGFGDD